MLVEDDIQGKAQDGGKWKLPPSFVAWLVWLILGCMSSGTFFVQWLNSLSMKYTPPQFEDLKVDHGKLSFTTRWKSSGGSIVLHLSDGRKLFLKCSGPFIDSESACYQKKVDNEWLNYKKQLTTL